MVRVIVVLVMFSAAGVLGQASARREFGWADVGGERLSGSATATARDGGGLDVDFGDARQMAVRLPADVTNHAVSPADHVPATVRWSDAKGAHEGAATLTVEETGTFVSGRLEATVDGRTVAGGLRVRLPQ